MLSHSMQSLWVYNGVQVKIWGAVIIFPHEALEVMESQDQQLHKVHRQHWQEYQASQRPGPKGETLQRLHVRENLRKKALWMLQNRVSKRGRFWPHWRSIETSFNTHRAPGTEETIHGGKKSPVPWAKKIYWIAQKAIRLGGRLKMCTLIDRKRVPRSALTNGQNTSIQNNIAREGFSMLDW